MGCAPITAFNTIAKMRGRNPMRHSARIPSDFGIIYKFDARSVDDKVNLPTKLAKAILNLFK